jgi:hypothetical protein
LKCPVSGFAVIAVKTGDAALGGTHGTESSQTHCWEGNGFEVSVPRRARNEIPFKKPEPLRRRQKSVSKR